jgi:hypothetical protein
MFDTDAPTSGAVVTKGIDLLSPVTAVIDLY